jgi:FMN phosphatase YigB (HAD superfamily)
MIRAVTFDFWETIAGALPGAMMQARHQAILEACEACDVEVESELLMSSLEEAWLRWESSWSAGRHFHPSEGAAMLVRALGIEGAAEETVRKAFLTGARGARLKTAPGIGPCLEALGERGVSIGIVCDVGLSGGELLRGLLDREGLLHHFSGWGFSDEVGHYKPAPQIFEAALGALDASPGEAIHVGDLRRTDVAGAAALGMRTVRYRGLQDDPDRGTGIEAEFILDSHRELPAIVDRIAR